MNKHTDTSLRSPLGRTRGLGSAKSGTHHWWLQRLTSIALIPLTIYPLAMLYIQARFGNYDSIIHWLRSPVSAACVILFLGVTAHHTAQGLQVVIEDYIHCETSKIASLILMKFVAVALFVIGTLATLKIMFGA
jgi:succinate dehydrogenase / fumarate reductase membrane anchor subunit